MFYRLIKKKCDEWMESPDCTIRELIQYIYTQNKMRKTRCAMPRLRQLKYIYS